MHTDRGLGVLGYDVGNLVPGFAGYTDSDAGAGTREEFGRCASASSETFSKRIVLVHFRR